MIRSILFLLLSFLTLSLKAQDLIPLPVKWEKKTGTFSAKNALDIVVLNPDLRSQAEYLKNILPKGNHQILSKPGSKNSIILALSKNDLLGTEGYSLSVKEKEIRITANTSKGIFYGIQTLRQLLHDGQVSQGEILDYPRFGWRGLMLDVSRHFFTVEEVKKYIDVMSQYKLNVFHWHLTDDEGWRIEIKSHPKLTEKGAWRVERHGRFGDQRPYPKEGEENTYGGFYTQEQIKDVIRYAAERNITIVPEIDLPGHSMALLTAYPELSTKKEPKFVNPGSKFAEWYGAHEFKMLIENTVNPADEKVYQVINDIMGEVAALFPGEYIHMGGDEAYHGYWEEDPSVQEFMKKNQLKDTKELQAYFVRRVNDIIASKGKKMIGWDEILDGGGLPKSTAVMSWRGTSGGIKAAKEGHYVVMSPTTYAYIDYTQGDKSVENPIYSDLSLARTYELEPVPDGVDPKYILGGQGNLWAEVIPTLNFAFYMAYPRALAIAEKVWSPKGASDFNGFLKRLDTYFTRFDEAGIPISKAVYEPVVEVKKEGEKYFLHLKTYWPGAEVYYSLNNTYPVKYSSKYEGPVEIPNGDLKLRTQTIKDGKELGRELIIPREDLIKRAK
jgi:hexosaminidase